MNLQIYKRAQGKHTRWGTYAAVMVLGVIGAYKLSEFFGGRDVLSPPLLRYGAPTVVVIALGAVMYWLINRPKTADFLIATEGEMKKVSWSTRKEVIGSTKVVIITTLIMAVVLFAVDTAFSWLFGQMGIWEYGQ